MTRADHALAAANKPKNAAQRSHPPGMVWIPGGEFMMETDSEMSFANERPASGLRPTKTRPLQQKQSIDWAAFHHGWKKVMLLSSYRTTRQI
jgi:hypothetical protein